MKNNAEVKAAFEEAQKTLEDLGYSTSHDTSGRFKI